jgi:hypothetical protein
LGHGKPGPPYGPEAGPGQSWSALP